VNDWEVRWLREEGWWRCGVFYSDWWKYLQPEVKFEICEKGENSLIFHNVNENHGNNLRSMEDRGSDGKFGRDDLEAIGPVDNRWTISER
jgi:hypothetical protein